MKSKRIHFKILVLSIVIISAIFTAIGLTRVFKYSYVSVKVAVEGLQPDNEALLRYVRNNYLLPPSTKPYNMSSPLTDPSMGQAAAVLRILNHKRKGFFVECGAYDGESRSNTYCHHGVNLHPKTPAETLHKCVMFTPLCSYSSTVLFNTKKKSTPIKVLERHLEWSGLLIEPNPANFKLLLSKNRKAYAVPACLSHKPHSVSFYPNFNRGKIIDGKNETTISVQCFTLWTVMLALNKTRTIDYFSLDVEGHEFEVLRGVPFELLDIRVMSVEWKHVAEGKDVLREYVESKGYAMVQEITAKKNRANDFIFVKK